MSQQLATETEVREFIMKVLLYEILKDGHVEQKERDALNLMFPVLKISRERFVELKKQVEGALPSDKEDQGALDYVALFTTVRKKLLEKYPAMATDEYLEQVAEAVGQPQAFMDSLVADWF